MREAAPGFRLVPVDVNDGLVGWERYRLVEAAQPPGITLPGPVTRRSQSRCDAPGPALVAPPFGPEIAVGRHELEILGVADRGTGDAERRYPRTSSRKVTKR